MLRVAESDEQLRRRLVEAAERHGAAVVHIPADERGSSYAFSVGAWRRFGRPEVVAIGLPREVAHAVVDTYVQRSGTGERFTPGTTYLGFLNDCPVTFEKVAKPYYPEFLGSAVLVYGDDDFPALQLIASSPSESRFPWEPDAPGGFAAHQPVLTGTGRPESWVPGSTGP